MRFLSVEEFDESVPLDPSEIPSAATAQYDDAEASTGIVGGLNAIADAQAVAGVLEAVSAPLQETQLTSFEEPVVQAAIEGLLVSIGKRRGTRVSIEGIGQTIKDIIKKVIAFFKKIFEKVKSWFTGGEKLIKKHEEAAKSFEKEHKEKEVEMKAVVHEPSVSKTFEQKTFANKEKPVEVLKKVTIPTKAMKYFHKFENLGANDFRQNLSSFMSKLSETWLEHSDFTPIKTLNDCLHDLKQTKASGESDEHLVRLVTTAYNIVGIHKLDHIHKAEQRSKNLSSFLPEYELVGDHEIASTIDESRLNNNEDRIEFLNKAVAYLKSWKIVENKINDEHNLKGAIDLDLTYKDVGDLIWLYKELTRQAEKLDQAIKLRLLKSKDIILNLELYNVYNAEGIQEPVFNALVHAITIVTERDVRYARDLHKEILEVLNFVNHVITKAMGDGATLTL
jgi:hypothetical protein